MNLTVAGASSASADIKAKADLFAIDIPTMTRLKQQVVAAPARPPGFQPVSDPWIYRVGPQDELRVTVFEHPELTNPSGIANELVGRTVNSDGKFFFPFVGQVQAAGRTVQEIQRTLIEGLKVVIKNPQVDVAVFRFRSQRVVISGEVRTPQTLFLSEVPPTLSEAIAQAGGFNLEADLGTITVTRGGNTQRVDMYAYYYQGVMDQNFLLQAGDVINVPERRYNKVFVLGEVGRPNSVLMPRGRYSLAEALADSGGVNPFAGNAGQIYVIRNPGNKPQIYHLDAASPAALLLAEQFDMRQRDVVYVDTVGVVRWARVVNNILPTAEFLRLSAETFSSSLPR